MQSELSFGQRFRLLTLLPEVNLASMFVVVACAPATDLILTFFFMASPDLASTFRSKNTQRTDVLLQV